LKGKEIRELFLDFFASRRHKVVPSSSLVPNDPTLLLTNAGMVQFKPYFLGEESPPFDRATSVQKCLRTTDIDEVGMTARHNTFFEMLGNFSFGDYYKETAIPWAWELVTEGLGIDPKTLWISVFAEDGEAERIWSETPGVDPGRIIRLGEEENFWDMGPTGPCGPCSEILFDRGADYSCGPGCSPGCECDRFLELWNLVFMQYDRQPDGDLLALPDKNIDTGLGLERAAAVKQGVPTIFETDLLSPLVEKIFELSGVRLGGSQDLDVSIKVIADHCRASAFLISDGVVPSNEGSGYILRRLLRRAVRHGRLLGIDDRFIAGIADVVVEMLGETYPGLKEHHRLIDGVIVAEEDRFGQTLEQGTDLLQEVMEEHRRAGREVMEGETVFYLHDTLGFPLELTEEIIKSRGMRVDHGSFERLMEEQRRKARSSREEEGSGREDEAFIKILEGSGASMVECHPGTEAESVVVGMVEEGRLTDSAAGGGYLEVVLDRTPFYPEAGGQVGDTGTIEGPSGVMEVEDTCYGPGGLVLHRGKLEGALGKGETVRARVDIGRRTMIARNHSATHILHWALRRVLGTHAKQAGSLVTPSRLRFDFTHFQPVTEDELIEIERLANRQVMNDLPVRALETSREEADRMGAIALFGEKYGEEVRMVEMGEFSLELCGGTHVSRTGTIGPIRVVSETGIGSGLRRIEATTGEETLDYYRWVENALHRAARTLKATPEQLQQRLEETVDRLRLVERESSRERTRDNAARAREIASSVAEDSPVVVARVDGENQKTLRDIADVITNETDRKAVVLAGASGGKAQLVVKITPELVSAGLNARELATEGGKTIGGGGGGREDMGAAGGTKIQEIDEALEVVEKTIRSFLEAGL
jgi:alanyl-tRNA synthetase